LNFYSYLDGASIYTIRCESGYREFSENCTFHCRWPGEFVTPKSSENTFAHFLVDNEFNVVFFHLRGTGLSQIPPQTEYDKFLTTSSAVEDIEEIRQDLIRRKLLNDCS
jgi:hypothetical protein